MPSLVTADIRPARRRTSSATAQDVKRDAHARHRRAWRDWLARGDLEADEPVVRLGTGWEVD